MAMEQKPFKLRSQGEDGSTPSFKAMGAVDTPAKHYSTDFGSHRHPHKSGGLNAMEETPNKKMHDSPANAMEKTPNKKMHDAPTKKMHDAPTKDMHDAPTKDKHDAPIKDKHIDWSKAPALNTRERRDFYKKHNLKQDATTTKHYYVSSETGKKVPVGAHAEYNKYPEKSSQIDYEKSGAWGKHWFENLQSGGD